ncbi:MAG: hypothetical protein HZA79_08105 [Sphingobacteriales bacterium]|nr:hypothetical protein [Sphingobacteriales bacterium]
MNIILQQLRGPRLGSAITCLLLMLFLLPAAAVAQQNLDFNSKLVITLNDGTAITLYAQTQGAGPGARGGKNYYYVPTQAMLSKNPVTQVPEFLFLKYVTEEREDQGGVSGALMHFLMQLGYTKDQLDELQGKLAAKMEGALVKGPVDLFAAEDANSFRITSGVVNKEGGMVKSLVTSGKAPLQEGAKVAVATNLNKFGAQLLAKTFDKDLAITDLSCDFFYKYYVKVNGLKAKIVVDYEKMSQVIKQDKVTAEYRRVETKDAVQESQSWNELHSVYDKMVENNAIIIQIDQGIPNATTEKLTELFFQMFMDKFAKPADDRPQATPPTEKEKEYLPGKKDAYGYYLDVKRIENSVRKKREVIMMNYNYMLGMPVAFSQNLKTWYNSVRDNKNCIASVNLNDPFFKHLDIRFVLDLEAKEMFDQEVNYVTVNVRKKRNSGNDFMDRVTIDKKFVAEKGITAAMTYAAGEDNNPDMYQYKVQWSLRGGNVFPPDPGWEKGQMEAVTLKPPVVPRTIEFEVDLDKLKAANISRATLQVRYKKYGEEIEENINVSPAKGESLVSKMLFMDRDTRGYVYRLVFNHTTEGKLALPWSAKINDNYVYAVIPEGFTDKTSDVFMKAIDAAKTIATPGPGGKVTVDKILDSFKEVLGVINN